MKQYRILGTPPTILPSAEYSFSIYGASSKIKLTLDSYGDYYLHTPYNVSEASAKRNPAYKVAVDHVTGQMLDSYLNAIKPYTEIHKKAVFIVPEQKYTDKLNQLSPRKYRRQLFNVSQPMISEAELMISAEESSRNECALSDCSISPSDLLEGMRNRWEQLRQYFDLVESSLEEINNRNYIEEYNAEKKSIEDYLYGPNEYVLKQMEGVCGQITSPENFILSYEYAKDDSMLNLGIHFVSDSLVNQQDYAASILASGKLSVKSKAKKDIELEQSLFFSGLSFYISSLCFNISANIKRIRVAVTRSNEGMYWVEFTRYMFSKMRNYSLNPMTQLLNAPNVIKINAAGNIVAMPIDKFNQQVRIQTAILDSSYMAGSDASYTISLADAKLICKFIPGDNNLLGLIAQVESLGGKTVAVDKKYEKILREIKNS
jgi:hypothetical protein